MMGELIGELSEEVVPIETAFEVRGEEVCGPGGDGVEQIGVAGLAEDDQRAAGDEEREERLRGDRSALFFLLHRHRRYQRRPLRCFVLSHSIGLRIRTSTGLI
jgi:hypothetical protein